MKNVIICVISVFFAVSFSFAEIEDSVENSTSETIKVSDGYSIVVPKGAEITRNGGQIVVEDPISVLNRRIQEIMDRLKQLEDEQGSDDLTGKEELTQTLLNIENQMSALDARIVELANNQMLLQEAVKAVQFSVGDLSAQQEETVIPEEMKEDLETNE